MKNLVKVVMLFIAITLGGSCFAQCNSRCQTAFKFVVSHEDRNLSGVVSKEPFRGAVARFGVNSAAHPKAVRDGFYTMPKLKALRYAQRLFYFGYWKPMLCDQIDNTQLAFKIADLSYNLGPIRAAILLQRALNMEGYALLDKGYMGDETLVALQGVSPNVTRVLLEYQAVGFYKRLAYKYPVMRAWKKVWFGRLAEEAV